jgi:hypothetical protein
VRTASVGVERLTSADHSANQSVSVFMDHAEPFLVGENFSRMAFQHVKLALELSIHFLFGWCGAWVPPGQ